MQAAGNPCTDGSSRERILPHAHLPPSSLISNGSHGKSMVRLERRLLWTVWDLNLVFGDNQDSCVSRMCKDSRCIAHHDSTAPLQATPIQFSILQLARRGAYGGSRPPCGDTHRGFDTTPRPCPSPDLALHWNIPARNSRRLDPGACIPPGARTVGQRLDHHTQYIYLDSSTDLLSMNYRLI